MPGSVYETDFENVADDLVAWSNRHVDATPTSGRRFLGQFGTEVVELRLQRLPQHARARVEFDLYVIRSWDGNSAEWGGERFEVAIDGDEAIVRTGFHNGFGDARNTQLWPGRSPNQQYPAGTGARERNTLGYTPDAVYHLVVEFAHRASSIAIVFRADRLQTQLPDGGVTLEDESWGLDNVSVRVVP